MVEKEKDGEEKEPNEEEPEVFYASKPDYIAHRKGLILNARLADIKSRESEELMAVVGLSHKDKLSRPIKQWIDDEILVKKLSSEEYFPKITHLKVE